jgi:hypothetical protein
MKFFQHSLQYLQIDGTGELLCQVPVAHLRRDNGLLQDFERDVRIMSLILFLLSLPVPHLTIFLLLVSSHCS